MDLCSTDICLFESAPFLFASADVDYSDAVCWERETM